MFLGSTSALCQLFLATEELAFALLLFLPPLKLFLPTLGRDEGQGVLLFLLLLKLLLQLFVVELDEIVDDCKIHVAVEKGCSGWADVSREESSIPTELRIK